MSSVNEGFDQNAKGQKTSFQNTTIPNGQGPNRTYTYQWIHDKGEE